MLHANAPFRLYDCQDIYYFYIEFAGK